MDNNSLNHVISITERKSIVISGLKKIENFDSEEFLINSSEGLILLKGKDLEIIRLDTNSGNISIKGIINYIEYIDDNINNKENKFFNKLFK